MSLDINLQAVRAVNVFYLNISTCYKPIAERVGIPPCIWKPEELDISKAEQLISPLRIAQEALDDFVECAKVSRRMRAKPGR